MRPNSLYVQYVYSDRTVMFCDGPAGLKYRDFGMQYTDTQVDGKHISFNPSRSVKQFWLCYVLFDASPTTSFCILLLETGSWEQDYIS